MLYRAHTGRLIIKANKCVISSSLGEEGLMDAASTNMLLYTVYASSLRVYSVARLSSAFVVKVISDQIIFMR